MLFAVTALLIIIATFPFWGSAIGTHIQALFTDTSASAARADWRELRQSYFYWFLYAFFAWLAYMSFAMAYHIINTQLYHKPSKEMLSKNPSTPATAAYFKKITSAEATPRPVEESGIAFSKGLRGLKAFSYYFLFGSAGLLLFSIVKYASFPSVGIVIFNGLFQCAILIGAWLNIKSVNKKIDRRKAIYQHGTVVPLTVREHKRKLVWYKSFANYRLVCKAPGAKKPVYVDHHSLNLWKTYPIGSVIYGLESDGEFFTGQSVGYEFCLD